MVACADSNLEFLAVGSSVGKIEIHEFDLVTCGNCKMRRMVLCNLSLSIVNFHEPKIRRFLVTIQLLYVVRICSLRALKM